MKNVKIIGILGDKYEVEINGNYALIRISCLYNILHQFKLNIK